MPIINTTVSNIRKEVREYYLREIAKVSGETPSQTTTRLSTIDTIELPLWLYGAKESFLTHDPLMSQVNFGVITKEKAREIYGKERNFLPLALMYYPIEDYRVLLLQVNSVLSSNITREINEHDSIIEIRKLLIEFGHKFDPYFREVVKLNDYDYKRFVEHEYLPHSHHPTGGTGFNKSVHQKFRDNIDLALATIVQTMCRTGLDEGLFRFLANPSVASSVCIKTPMSGAPFFVNVFTKWYLTRTRVDSWIEQRHNKGYDTQVDYKSDEYQLHLEQHFFSTLETGKYSPTSPKMESSRYKMKKKKEEEEEKKRRRRRRRS